LFTEPRTTELPNNRTVERIAPYGAFLYGVLQGWEARHILLFANAVSAIKCTRLGGRTGIPSVEEVLDFLRTRGEDILVGALGKETQR